MGTTAPGAIIQMRVEGADTSQRQVDAVSQSMTRMSDTVQNAQAKLTQLAAAVGIGGGLSYIIAMSDQYTKFTAQLRLATTSQAAFSQAMQDVKRISTVAQSSLGETGTLYARIANGTRELGVSQKQVANITETVSLALKVSGATAQESSSAMLQLSQSFASGTLRGEEFNAVNEAAPRLMKALADGMGVPVGALKEMASNGQITSKIMAETLPAALESLRNEATKIQTISGALQVLKDRAMEFTAVRSQDNGMVAGLTAAIGLLADNLVLVTGALSTLTAVKLATWLDASVTKTMADVAAKRALVATNLATAESEVAAAATASLLATARVNELRATVLAAQGNIQLALTTNGLIPAQASQLAMTEALDAALLKLAVAQRAASVTASAGSTVMAALGGPIGLVVAALGIAATAWMWYSSKSEEANANAAGTTESSTQEIVENLEKQNVKLRERLALQQRYDIGQGAAAGGPEIERLAEFAKRLDVVGKKIADAQKAGKEVSSSDWLEQVNVQGMYDDLKKIVDANKGLRAEVEKSGTASKDLLAVRQRLVGVSQQYLDDLTKLQNAYEKGGISQKEYISAVSQLATDTYKSSEAGKDAEKQAKASESANKKQTDGYRTLIDSVKEKTAANRLELLVGENATDSQKAQIKLDQQLSSGKKSLTSAAVVAADAEARLAIIAQAASEQALKAAEAQRDITKYVAASAVARKESTAALAVETAGYGKSADARAIAMVAVDAQAWKEKALDKLREDHKPISDKLIEQLDAEVAARTLVGQATLGQSKALQYAAQLAGENKKDTAESISDPRARATALLQIDIDIWQERIRLAGAGTAAQKILQTEYDTWYANRLKGVGVSVDLTQATQMLDIMAALDDAAKSAAEGMANSFGQVGTAIGSLTTTLSGYGRTQAAIAAQLAAATQDARNDPVKLERAKATAAQQSAQAQVKSYGDMASAAKGFFKQNSLGYKTMETLEKGFRAYEMAMALQSMVKKIFFKETEVAANVGLNATKIAGEATASAASTGLAATEASAWGITAVVKALASLPYPMNLIAGATTLAAVLAVGASMLGGVGGASAPSVSEQRQKSQGTGTVLGDSNAKSDSIAASIELAATNSSIELSHTAGMLRSLRAIETSIGGLGAQIVQGGFSGTITDSKSSNFFAKLGNSIFGGNTTTVDTGITANKTTVGSVLNGGLQASQYTDTKTDGGWFHSDKYRTQMTALSAGSSDQFAKVISNMTDAIKEDAKLLGVGGDAFTNQLSSFVVDLGKISLKGLSGEDIQKQLEAVFSKLGDDMAKSAISGLGQFQQVGEGYLETLTRIASNYANLDSVLAAAGMTFGAVGLGSIAMRENLIAAAGGMDDLASKMSDFADNFLTEAQRLAPVQKYVDDGMAALGLSWVTTREQFAQVTMGIDKTTVAGQAQFVALMDLEAAFAKTHAATVDLTMSEQAIADQRKDLQTKLDELTMTEAQLHAKERLTIPAVNLALYDQVYATQKLRDAATAASDALKGTVDRLASVQASTLTYRDSLMTGSLSTLTPMQKYLETQRQYAAALAKSQKAPDDTSAASAAQAAATAFLTASQVVNASSAAYVNDRANVLSDMTKLADIAGSQITDAQKQLDVATQQVTGIATLNTTAVGIQQAIIDLANGGTVVQAPALDMSTYTTASNESQSVLVAEIKRLNASMDEMKKAMAQRNVDARDDHKELVAAIDDVAPALGDEIGASTTQARFVETYPPKVAPR